MSQTKNDPCQDSPVAWFVVLDRAERNTTLDVLRKPRAVCDRWACASSSQSLSQTGNASDDAPPHRSATGERHRSRDIR